MTVPARPVEVVENRPPGRRKSPKRPVINIPDLARRGRTTFREFAGLLSGAFLAYVRWRRSRGARGFFSRSQVFLAWLMGPFVNHSITDLSFPMQLRVRLEILGPTYIKLGQILSLRQDLLPEVVTKELRGLLSDLPEVEFDLIKEIIEDDLGRPIEELFDNVELVPLGSASIAQIHRATTREGDDVILKVVKPNIRELLYRDSDLLRLLGWFLQFIIPRYQPRKVIDEFCEYTLYEIEMTREADNAEVFAENFKDLPEIVFPKVYRAYSGINVLCMEYLEGARPDAQLAEELSFEEKQKVIDLGAAAIIRMLYEDGFFHADLHPGNLMVLSGGRVGFIDLGMVGRLDPDLRHHLLYLFFGLVMEDFENAARHLAAVGHTEQGSDVVGFRRAVKETCRRWRRAATFTEFSLGQLILESMRLGAKYRVFFPVEMVLMVKALVTYEGVGYLLDPEFNVAEVSQRHINRIFRMQFSPVRLLREGIRGAPDILDAVVKLAMLIDESLRMMEDRARRKPEGPLAGLRATVFGGFCLLAGAVLAAFKGPIIVWVCLLALGLILPLRRG